MSVNDSEFFPEQSPAFMTTRWSLVISASQKDTGKAQKALGELCQVYWKPIYVYIRRQGYDRDDAFDLTQDFFTRLLEKRDIDRADPRLGRFRSFLLGAVNHFLANEREKKQARKRGGGITILSLDAKQIEHDIAFDPPDTQTPEKVFIRQWAQTLLHSVLTDLQNRYTAEGKGDLFGQLNVLLTSDRDKVPYKKMAESLGMTEGSLKVAAHRLRKRYRDLLKLKVAETVLDPKDVEDEIRFLISMLEG